MFKIFGAEIDVWEGAIITAKIKISSKKPAKTTIATLKEHDMNIERFDMSR